MEKRIELECRGRPIGEIEELNLDNCRSTQIAGLTDDFKSLETLSLINIGLTTLKGFPNLPKLRKLELSDNRISGNLNFLQGCPKLTSINLSGNKIKDIETLEPLKGLKDLQVLDLFNCEVTNTDDYRTKVFQLLPSLVYLDGFDKQNEEADDDDGEDSEVCDLNEEEDDDEDGLDDEDDEEEGEDDENSEDDDEGDDEEGEVADEDDIDDDEDDDDEEDDEEEAVRGVKRKHDEEEEDDS